MGELRGAGTQVLGGVLPRGRPRGANRAPVRGPGSEPHLAVVEIFRSRTRDEWQALNDEHDAMIEPVLELGEALASELVREREMTLTYEQPELGEMRQLGFPISSRGPRRRRPPAPGLGEHTAQVLSRDAATRRRRSRALEESGAAAGPDDDRQRGAVSGMSAAEADAREPTRNP